MTVQYVFDYDIGEKSIVVSVVSDLNFGFGEAVCLRADDIERMTDEEIVEVSREFVKYAREARMANEADRIMSCGVDNIPRKEIFAFLEMSREYDGEIDTIRQARELCLK